MDVVYLCRNGENEELRFSMRSLAANLPHDRVWLFGGWPGWVTGVECVRVNQWGTRFQNTTSAMAAACQHPDVSDPFILFNDDFFIMQPVKEVPVLDRGPFDAMIGHYQGKYGTGMYLAGMIDTARLMTELGLDDPLSYELHVPMVIHKAVMLKALELGAGVPSLHKRSLYGNLLGARGTTIDDVKVYDADQEIPQGTWVSSVDSAFSGVQPVLRYLFPSPCQYEDPEGMNMTKPALPTTGVQVFSPNRTYTGMTAGVQFINGTGVVEPAPNMAHILGWFKDHGYTIGGAIGDAEAPEPVSEPEPQPTDDAGQPIPTPEPAPVDPDAPATPDSDADSGAQNPPSDTPAPFDPSQHTVDEVLAYMADADADECQRVQVAEVAGKDRAGIAKFVK